MIDIKVNIVHTEVLQALVYHLLDMLLTAHAAFYLLICARKKFRRNDNVFALCKVFQRTSEILLARSALIGDGSIEKVHAELQPSADYLTRVFFIDRPAVLTV